MAITERKAVALDSAVDLLLLMYDISDIQPVKPLKWLRGDIKTEKSTKMTVEVGITFWLYGDPNNKLEALITLDYQHVFAKKSVWTPKVAEITTGQEKTRWIYKDKKWVKA